MIKNLPSSINGVKYPFVAIEGHLRRGMCLEVHSNGGVIRRGVVFLEPSTTPHFMWWNTKTRFVNGEVPICHGLLDEIPVARRETLTVHSVTNFNDFFARIPFAIKGLLGYTRATLRGHHVSGGTDIKVDLPVTLTAPLRAPPPTVSKGHSETSLTVKEIRVVDPPGEIPSFALLTKEKKERKPRRDKGKKRGGCSAGDTNNDGGKLNSREMHIEGYPSAPVPPVPAATVPDQFERLQGQMDLITRVFQAVSQCFSAEQPPV